MCPKLIPLLHTKKPVQINGKQRHVGASTAFLAIENQMWQIHIYIGLKISLQFCYITFC